MADTDHYITAGIIYYCQEKYHQHVQNLAREGLKKYSNDPVLQFFKIYGMLMEDRVQDAIRRLEPIKDDPTVVLCSTMALIYAHKRSERVDREAVADLENKLKETRKSAGPKALYYAGMFLWLMGRTDKAREYIDRMLKISNRSREGLVLRGWLDLSSEKESTVNKSIRYFEEGIQDNKDIFALIGKAQYFMAHQNYSGALDVINQIIVNYPPFLPALTLKMRLFLAQQDWDQTLETAQRILLKDGANIDAFQILTIHSVTREGSTEKALNYLRELINALDAAEPRNPMLHLHKILPISSLCGRNQPILKQVSVVIGRIFQTAPHAEVATALANNFILQGNVTEAAGWYATAMKLDGNHLEGLTGVIQCQILQGQLEEAEQQLDFLHEIQESIGGTKELCYIQALLASRQGKEEQIITELLKKAVELHYAAVRGLPLGVEYFEKLNPTFLINIVQEYLVLCPKQPKAPGEPLSPLLKQALSILTPVVSVAPALTEPLYYTAQIKYLAGNLEGAQGSLQRCIEVDTACADFHLLMAQIHYAQGKFAECSVSLETGVSHNFKVRERPLYHLIRARVLRKTGELQEAIKTLKMTMSLQEMKRGALKKSTWGSLNSSDKVSIYLELAELLRLNGEQHEATKIIQDAINEFGGTPEEIRIVVANADMAVAKGDVEMALNVLRDIAPNQPYYTEVKQKMAQIYLNNRKDKKLYIGCYRELCEQQPGPHTSVLLGDALMNIQEPEKALEVYNEALHKNPQDASLANRIGQALIKTHQYKKAVNYYEAAQKISGQDFLCCDLAELLIKLKQYSKAEAVLKQALAHEPVSDLTSMVTDAKCLGLLGTTYQNYKKEESADILNKALELQQRILKRVPMEQPEMAPAQKQATSEICVQLAEHYVDQRNYEQAANYYKEAMVYSQDSKVKLQLSRLYLMMGDLDSCENHCSALLENHSFKEEAAMMMADVMFRKQDYTKSIELFDQILEENPDNFAVLSKLIDLLRRSGNLSKAPMFFEKALANSSRTTLEPGYNYCKGLYCWYLGQPNDGLKYFNKARKDSEWGQNAISNMVQICLNPDNEIVGGEVFEAPDEADGLLGEKRESEMLGVRTAEKLLKEFHPRTLNGRNQLALLQNHCLMATKDKANVETALSAFTEMATSEKDNVCAILAVAQAYMILRQTPRARNQLKRLSKVPWSLADAEDLEKSWLLLADVYIKLGKYDIATELLKRCLLYNKSCYKAYEYLGFIMENEQSYKDAAANYRLAWDYSNQSNPAVGFRLAFNYLKDKKYVDAIDICHKVLKAHPTYPKIEREILAKAQTSLKP
ncbi:tetratricopeptide repeat protein 21B [Xenopus laevis]|uniref:Tetratricopeptide repeat protein 21B n=1 Tax=Xenopus laevis TaxID=8355 RepID=TT21B_XENLA|nr:tetratricopeptide repeat protein 21B [Xenopus laevis]Q6INC1.1 RecName: Full=Tetratricopeptide repeat protein 21B; Short=TPR repeat protein 21B [Xenopus laevis]AAH72362.1 MGC83540 protein [Xenopus laevis]